MSHFTTQIFFDQIRNKDFQSTLHWLQFVVHTLNYHNLCEILWKFCDFLTNDQLNLKMGISMYFQCDIKTDFPKSVHIFRRQLNVYILHVVAACSLS